MDIAAAISDYGFPIIAAMGMGYFIFYVWKWVTTEINPKIGEASSTLIKLVDRIRMLDNDMIRLNTKLSMVLEYQGDIKKVADQKDLDDLDELLHKYKSFSQGFDSTGDNK
jgi:hypothetical protein